MTRTQWRESQRALRHLLKDIPLGRRNYASDRLVQYKFGAWYVGNRRMWLIYNGMTDNVIATLRNRDNRLTIRYRPNSRYAEVFKNRVEGWDNLTIQRVPSQNLRRHRGVARDALRGIVQRAITEHRASRGVQTEVRPPNGQFVDFVVQSAQFEIRSSYTADAMTIATFDGVITEWFHDMHRGMEFQTAYDRLVHNLMNHNYNPQNNDWSRWFNPTSLEFGSALADSERRPEAIPFRAEYVNQAQFADRPSVPEGAVDQQVWVTENVEAVNRLSFTPGGYQFYSPDEEEDR